MKLSDDSIANEEGDLVFISKERFLLDIARGDNCFLCGKEYDGNKTDEHIIPKWILREFNLYNKFVNLPNDTKFPYRDYVVPCCGACNKKLDQTFENPLSKLMLKGFDCVTSHVQEYGTEKLFLWTSLIFIKTHLKDESLKMERNLQKSDSLIADALGYDREIFHHTYCLARSTYSKAQIQEDALGSFYLIQVKKNHSKEDFDFIDCTNQLTFGVVIGDVGMISVFGDFGATLRTLKNNGLLATINGPLNNIQFRELVLHFSCCVAHMKNYPQFITSYDGENTEIWCRTPLFCPDYEEYNPLVLGHFMEQWIWPLAPSDAPEDERKKLSSGKITYLSDENRDFKDF